jgi:transglutaminase-like putative cysteine protease
MIFDVSAELVYTVRFPSAMILSVHAQHNASQTVLEEDFAVEPRVPVREYADDLGNRFIRMESGKHKELAIHYRAKVECDFAVRAASRIAATPVAALEDHAITYLFPSRYCQSDRLGRLAWDLFGKVAKPHDKVIAITEWIHDNVEYVPGSTDSGTSADDTVLQRVGVCRDFAHLGIALCRALNIPARYFTGYAYQLDPPDFHACFECYIGGEWMVFDATQLAHMNGLVRIASGRDAADTAVANVFGSASCTRAQVQCELGAGQTFTPISRRDLGRRGVSLPTG